MINPPYQIKPFDKKQVIVKKSSESKKDQTQPLNLAHFLVQWLGEYSHSRLEAILSELVIFSMNNGCWRAAEKIQAAYELVAKTNSLGPLISSTYIALGYQKLDPAIEHLKAKLSEVTNEDHNNLKAFIGMFMFYNQQLEESRAILEEVVASDNEQAQQMARNLIQGFWGNSLSKSYYEKPKHSSKDDKQKLDKQKTNNQRVPGLPF